MFVNQILLRLSQSITFEGNVEMNEEIPEQMEITNGKGRTQSTLRWRYTYPEEGGKSSKKKKKKKGKRHKD